MIDEVSDSERVSVQSDSREEMESPQIESLRSTVTVLRPPSVMRLLNWLELELRASLLVDRRWKS